MRVQTKPREGKLGHVRATKNYEALPAQPRHRGGI